MKMNLLLVEDATIYLILFQQIFEDDFNIISTNNVIDAKAVIEDQDYQFDVIVLDLVTPGTMNLITQIKKNKRLSLVPIIVIAAGEDLNDRIRAFDYGAYDYMTKPITKESSLSRVLDAANSFRRIRELDSQRDLLMNNQNIDQLTQIYKLDTAKWLVDEKIHENPNLIKSLFIFKIEGIDDVYLEEGNSRGDELVKDIATFISTHFRNIDIIGRISHDQIIVFVNHEETPEYAIQRKNDLMRLFNQKRMSNIPEDVSLAIGVTTRNDNTSYEQMYNEAYESLLNQDEKAQKNVD